MRDSPDFDKEYGVKSMGKFGGGGAVPHIGLGIPYPIHYYTSVRKGSKDRVI